MSVDAEKLVWRQKVGIGRCAGRSFWSKAKAKGSNQRYFSACCPPHIATDLLPEDDPIAVRRAHEEQQRQ